MNKQQKVDFVINTLKELYPEIPIPLDHKDPYTLLIAVLLSAQSTDVRVNKITPLLFKEADNPYDMIKLSIDQIREIIKKIAANGTTILLASHLLDEVEKVCSHVLILREGKSLYSGSVENMIASHGFFTLQSDNLDLLKKVLEEHPFIGTIKKEENHLLAYLKEPLSGSELNKILFEKGINLSYLVHRKESLEEQFLELTKSK